MTTDKERQWEWVTLGMGDGRNGEGDNVYAEGTSTSLSKRENYLKEDSI